MDAHLREKSKCVQKGVLLSSPFLHFFMIPQKFIDTYVNLLWSFVINQTYSQVILP